jgi:hypothetical protein
MTFPTRAALAIAAAGLLVGVLAGSVAAAGPSISLNATNGECVNAAAPATLADGTTACGGAIAGSRGFSGRIFGAGTVLLSGLVCVHSPGDGSFTSYGGAYALSVNVGGQALGGASTENVVGGQDCSAGPATVSGSPIQVTFPASGSLGYTLSISGVSPANGSSAFRAFDRMIVRIYVTSSGQSNVASSPAVVPPGPPGEIPESPAVPALLISAGVLTIFVLQRRMRAAGELRS